MNKSFWVKRVQEFGHTGWSDKLTYLYDQNLRLILVENIINKYFTKRVNYSLDYGCGSGDFSNLLSKYSSNVLAVDIAEEIVNVAKSNYKNDNIEFLLLDKSLIKDNNYDVINLITVLQHILDDNDLVELLNNFYSVLTKDGIMIVIDSFGDNDSSDYLKFRNYHKFLQTLKENNFKVLETATIYHPQTNPTKLFNLYRKSFILRGLNKLGYFSLLNKIANKISQYDNALSISNSNTKLIIVKKDIK